MKGKVIPHAMTTDEGIGFRKIISAYKQSIYWHVRRMVVDHEDAQDVTQETFVRVYRSFHTYDPNQSFECWIYRIATNEALRLLARKRNEIPLSDCLEANRIIDADYVNYSDLETVKLQKAILSLPQKQQLAFNLRYYDELSFEEIAEISDSTPSAVKANYHLAKEKIIKYLTEND